MHEQFPPEQSNALDVCRQTIKAKAAAALGMFVGAIGADPVEVASAERADDHETGAEPVDPRKMSQEDRLALIQAEIDRSEADNRNRAYRSEREIRRIARKLRIRQLFRLDHSPSTIDEETRRGLTYEGLFLYERAFRAVGVQIDIKQLKSSH